jgi:NifB/MoaA-like Fe-S oxidoreductase
MARSRASRGGSISSHQIEEIPRINDREKIQETVAKLARYGVAVIKVVRRPKPK